MGFIPQHTDITLCGVKDEPLPLHMRTQHTLPHKSHSPTPVLPRVACYLRLYMIWHDPVSDGTTSAGSCVISDCQI